MENDSVGVEVSDGEEEVLALRLGETDKVGEFVSVPVHDMESEYVGVQEEDSVRVEVGDVELLAVTDTVGDTLFETDSVVVVEKESLAVGEVLEECDSESDSV